MLSKSKKAIVHFPQAQWYTPSVFALYSLCPYFGHAIVYPSAPFGIETVVSYLQQLDRVQGHRDRVTHCQQGLNLKVGKKRPHLGTPDPIWAKCSKSGQNVSRIGQKKIIHSVIDRMETTFAGRRGWSWGITFIGLGFNLLESQSWLSLQYSSDRMENRAYWSNKRAVHLSSIQKLTYSCKCQ